MTPELSHFGEAREDPRADDDPATRSHGSEQASGYELPDIPQTRRAELARKLGELAVDDGWGDEPPSGS
jgi:hypothetical protein